MGPQFFWWGGMWIFPLIGLVVMLFVVYMIFGRGGFRNSCCRPFHDNDRYSTDNKNPESALDILNKRYAKGEISKDEFERMKRDILN